MGESWTIRIAVEHLFFHQGIELITENPFGSGPRKDAFLVLLQKEFNDPIIQQSNSHYGVNRCYASEWCSRVNYLVSICFFYDTDWMEKVFT
ncbi:Uncharacterised protein [Cedecea neteri]|uniref:Uncharacterized protein n=1 Tax=Cedecea neteri TaxID=158822 RepID=A0A2X2TCZ6_9ENTR|nr:Uncharacterised protein [Cedecea neteri]